VNYIIACETLKPELSAVMGDRDYPIAWIPSGKHSKTEVLRQCIQEAVDAVSEEYSAVLLVFGFCGNSLAGVTARRQPLILPRVADCIPLFLGSQAERDSYGAGYYFFTEGYMRSESTVISEFSRCVEKYGAEEGTDLMKEMLKHYADFAVIDTGAFDGNALAQEIRPFADALNLRVSVIPGNIRLLRKLIAGDWNEDEFLIAPPGGAIIPR
jgi:hypothetical protein